jgi:hypothetical protein
VNGKAAISPEMAIRLAKAFGSTPETWLALQTAFDLAQARKHAGKINVKRYGMLIDHGSIIFKYVWPHTPKGPPEYAIKHRPSFSDNR